ncbi:hypothetical protein RIR_jg5684.t1 [Rhizophagus irregularis DAOM 181602=DAOM 197198]|nr:hypothetical protein RIR_jg5684.t1 [Rhizophagus irregularis DAOM 181602=DAOM 197198]
MLVDIEKYVIQGRMDSASIYPLLKHDYSDQPIYKKDLYNAVYQFSAAKYLSDTLYINKEFLAIPWIHKRFTTGAQSTQRIESINRHIHDKVDQVTSLYDLLLNIKDHVRNEEHFKYFELERNAIPTIDMPMLNTRFLVLWIMS